MRISKAYWIWGQFPIKDTLYLNSIKDHVQSILNSPQFDIHLTLCGPFAELNSDFLNSLSNISKTNQSITLNLEKFDFCDQIFTSFFIKTDIPTELNNLRNNIYKIAKYNIKKKYVPHISLAYGNHKKSQKNLLISKMPKLKKEILISKIALVDVNEELDIWRIMNTYNLQMI